MPSVRTEDAAEQAVQEGVEDPGRQIVERPAPTAAPGQPRPAVVPMLQQAVDLGASDLHLKPMRPPLVRQNGKLVPLENQETLDPQRLEEMLRAILGERQRETLRENLQVDFGYSVPGLSRFRATIFYQRSTLAAVFRRIPFEFPTLDDWGLPELLRELCSLKRGLVLVTGPTGAGKSSTLAAMIKEISQTREAHIVCIEDPIEFLIRDDRAAITQREVGTDCVSFRMGLRNALRQDPDVIMVGEMRDEETVRTVLTAAETGHLVLSTLHTNSAAQTLDRILDTFSSDHQSQVRMQLANSLEGIVSMQLLPRRDGEGMTAAVEILRATPRIRKMLENGGVSEITTEIEKSVSLHRMQTMDQSLVALVLTGLVDRATAESHAHDRGDFDLLLREHLGDRQEGEDDDMFPYCDYSKISELEELRNLRDEAEERQQTLEAEKERAVAALRQELDEKSEEAAKLRATLERGKEEFQKLREQISFQKQDYEGRIKKLQDRVRQLARQNAGNG